jgi:hypothetical protein
MPLYINPIIVQTLDTMTRPYKNSAFATNSTETLSADADKPTIRLKRHLQRNRQNSHNSFYNFYIDFADGKMTQVQRTIRFRADLAGIKLPVKLNEKILKKGLMLSPELMAFTFFLDTCATRLLNFLLFFKYDLRSGVFPFNAQVISHFNEYCELFSIEPYKEATIKASLRTLVDYNIALSCGSKQYLLNPHIVAGYSDAEKHSLIQKYTDQLKLKGKDPILQYLPLYKKN